PEQSYQAAEQLELATILRFIDTIHLAEQGHHIRRPSLGSEAETESVYEVPTPIGSPIDDHPIDIDEDDTLINPSQPLTLPTTLASYAITMSYQPSASLRNGTDPQTNHPTWTHTKNVQVNHELDSLRAIYDTIADTTSGFTADQRTNLIVEHIKKRAATIRIGATFGWSKVPESELQRDFVRLAARLPSEASPRKIKRLTPFLNHILRLRGGSPDQPVNPFDPADLREFPEPDQEPLPDENDAPRNLIRPPSPELDGVWRGRAPPHNPPDNELPDEPVEPIQARAPSPAAPVRPLRVHEYDDIPWEEYIDFLKCSTSPVPSQGYHAPATYTMPEARAPKYAKNMQRTWLTEGLKNKRHYCSR
ncbi:hypothetical protein BGZ59_003700, partial [Podila verticillata]